MVRIVDKAKKLGVVYSANVIEFLEGARAISIALSTGNATLVEASVAYIFRLGGVIWPPETMILFRKEVFDLLEEEELGV